MFSLLLLFIQQILKDQGFDHTNDEVTSLLSKICKDFRKAKGTSVNVSSGSGHLALLLALLFRGDFSRNKEMTKKSVLKRISRAADNLIGESSVIRGDNSYFMDTRKFEYLELFRSVGMKTKVTAKQILLLDNYLGNQVRSGDKLFKYSDYMKDGLSAYTIKGLDDIDFFEMVIDTFANSVQFHLPIGVTLVMDFEFATNAKGNETSDLSKYLRRDGGQSNFL